MISSLKLNVKLDVDGLKTPTLHPFLSLIISKMKHVCFRESVTYGMLLKYMLQITEAVAFLHSQVHCCNYYNVGKYPGNVQDFYSLRFYSLRFENREAYGPPPAFSHKIRKLARFEGLVF